MNKSIPVVLLGVLMALTLPNFAKANGCGGGGGSDPAERKAKIQKTLWGRPVSVGIPKDASQTIMDALMGYFAGKGSSGPSSAFDGMRGGATAPNNPLSGLLGGSGSVPGPRKKDPLSGLLGGSGSGSGASAPTPETPTAVTVANSPEFLLGFGLMAFLSGDPAAFAAAISSLPKTDTSASTPEEDFSDVPFVDTDPFEDLDKSPTVSVGQTFKSVLEAQGQNNGAVDLHKLAQQALQKDVQDAALKGAFQGAQNTEAVNQSARRGIVMYENSF